VPCGLLAAEQITVTFTYRLTSEMLKQLDFSQRSLCENLFAEDIGDLLDSDPLTGLYIRSGTIVGC
jgi:hypothetical protein